MFRVEVLTARAGSAPRPQPSPDARRSTAPTADAGPTPSTSRTCRVPTRPGSAAPAAVAALPAITTAGDHLPQDIAARVRRGTLRRVTRGSYVTPVVADDVRGAELARIAAVHRRLIAPHVFSHASAALVWGLPRWRSSPVVHVYQASRPGSRRDPRVQRHLATILPADVTEVAGLPVTSVARTAFDCARTMPPLPALVVADAALRAGAAPDDLDRLTAGTPVGAGVARARGVLALADAGAESAQESALRFVLLRAGLPQPQTQVRVETHLGHFWADLGWTEWRVLIEYDGRPKYADPEALIREKRRHDALVEAGWRVLRVTREDLRAPDLLVVRVLRLLPPGVALTRRPHLAWR